MHKRFVDWTKLPDVSTEEFEAYNKDLKLSQMTMTTTSVTSKGPLKIIS